MQHENTDIQNHINQSKRNYMGLTNLGNTCYMNSLLQTLFMTRQFRECLFQRWLYDQQKDPAPEDCIPYQLQLLFARMQTLRQNQIDARKLIKSFQWDAQESFAQHDVQEFCRVLFDAIQQSCSSQEQEFISKIYESSLESYVRCLTCGYESLRQDKFMDLSLTVKSDFDNVYNESLEKALKYFLKPENLSDGNLYFCDSCNKKVEALKGLRFKQLSDILTIQLNRFELDLQTFDRKKVNNWVSYPFVLNVNNFLQEYDKITVFEDVEFIEERANMLQQRSKEKQEKQVKFDLMDQYDDPLRRKRQNRKPSPDQQLKKQARDDIMSIKDDNNIQNKNSQQQQNLENYSREDQISQFQREHQELDQKFQYLEQQNKVSFISTAGNASLINTADEAYDLDNDILFGNNAFELKEMVMD